jgi:hypothetical protein
MRNQTFQFGYYCLTALALLFFASALTNISAFAGSTPELFSVSPRGIQRGKEHRLILKGLRLDDAQEVFFYGEGITTKSVTVVDPKKLTVVVNVAPDCRLGEHILQVRCGKGISDFRSVFVGPYPAIKESEPNDDCASAEKIEINHTVAGQMKGEDVDYFVVSLKLGQRLSVEVEAVRLGLFFDPLIAVYDADQKEIAVCDDTELFSQDGFLTVTAPADGDYFLMVRDAAYRAQKDTAYRLHVGEFERPRIMFPAGGKSGEKLASKIYERPTPDAGGLVERAAAEFQLPDAAESTEVFGDGPSALPLRVSGFENINRPDDAGNFSAKHAIEVPTPVAINGRFTEARKHHYYKFTAKKNQKLAIDVFAKRIGSPLDPIINVFDEKNKSLISSDDAKVKPDSFLVFNPPADGTYALRVIDYFNRGGIDMIYRVEITPAKPLLALNIKRNDRFSQRRMAMAIPQGGRFAAVLSAKKEHFAADVQLQFDGLPEGVTATMLPLKKSAKEMPVVFEATEDAAIDLKKVTVSGVAKNEKIESKDVPKADAKSDANGDAKAKPPGPVFDTEFTVTSLDSRGNPNNFVYHSTVVKKLAVGVIEKLPFHITVEPLKGPLVRNGSAKVKVIAHRDEGFKEKIRLQFPYRPVGVGTTYQIEMKADQTEIEYPINANKGAQLGQWPFYVIANANVSGPAWASSQLETVSVEEPFVTMESKRTVGARNETVRIVCQVQQLREFSGAATAVLKSLPPHTTVAGPVTFDKSSETIEFELETTEKTPFGQHKSIFVEVDVPVGEGRSVARAGNVVLQINQPLKQQPNVAMTEAAQ